MITRRALLTGMGIMGALGAAWSAGAYCASMAAADTRLTHRSSVIDTSSGTLEYAIAGHGPPVMMIHGTGGGFDQGLLLAHR